MAQMGYGAALTRSVAVVDGTPVRVALSAVTNLKLLVQAAVKRLGRLC
jgi:hypothetical protein